MIKIKDYILNENEIVYIEEFDAQSLGIMLKGKDKCILLDAHIEDIEWNYEQSNIEEDEYIELSNKYQRLLNRNEELEEKNKTFEDYNKDLNNQLDKFKEGINKAIEYIKENKDGTDCCGEIYTNLGEIEIEELLKILKGSE